ncbi:MAG: cytochrome C [Deltaproteobacteria bacterium RIFOXYD12_FULL_57_12]|nr:MAG: cytochrome C [Deltaproteobacteria bacterium RIFOXYD12_FULL_57_12]
MNGARLPAAVLNTLILAVLFLIAATRVSSATGTEGREPPTYVGSEACKTCHPEEYDSFVAYAKKAKSFSSIERLRRSLSEEEIGKCYACHTTGYGKPGGFVSLEQTPHLKDSGCEVCHGPGGDHLEKQDAATIKGGLTKKDCEVCHISERVRAFRYKPLIHGGAH